MQAALQRYTAAIARQHHHDEIIDDSVPSDPEQIGSGIADGSLPDSAEHCSPRSCAFQLRGCTG
jgi:hypothetical protein